MPGNICYFLFTLMYGIIVIHCGLKPEDNHYYEIHLYIRKKKQQQQQNKESFPQPTNSAPEPPKPCRRGKMRRAMANQNQ